MFVHRFTHDVTAATLLYACSSVRVDPKNSSQCGLCIAATKCAVCICYVMTCMPSNKLRMQQQSLHSASGTLTCNATAIICMHAAALEPVPDPLNLAGGPPRTDWLLLLAYLPTIGMQSQWWCHHQKKSQTSRSVILLDPGKPPCNRSIPAITPPAFLTMETIHM